MYKVIEQFCNNQQKNGLILLDMPTGSGKTYNVLKFIANAVISGDSRKFFFVTSLKKNLPQEDLHEHFIRARRDDLFGEKFILVDSNAESVIAGLPQIGNAAVNTIGKVDEYTKLDDYVKAIIDCRNEKKGGNRNKFLKTLEDKFRVDIEPAFRRWLEAKLKSLFPSAKARKEAIKCNPKWQWVATLYPSVFLKDKQIIFMSMDKFLSYNATIVESATMLYNSDILNNAVVFIDEFDATKETMLKNIIENGLRDKIDYIDLFRNIYSALRTRDFPAILTTASKKRQERKYKVSLKSIIENFKRLADETYGMYSLQYSHKTDNSVIAEDKNFLFHDHVYHSILKNDKKFIQSVRDDDERVNSIKFTQTKPCSENNNIHMMLGKLRGFISYFIFGVNILAGNYMECKAERRDTQQDEFTREEAVRTILAEFGLNNTYINYLCSQVMMCSKKTIKTDDKAMFDYDLTFYEKGFRYYVFEDAYNHDMHSKISMFSFQQTPEKLLLRFCEKAKVIGVSATATLKSAVGNFDLEYISSKLGDKYCTISDEDKRRLNEEFNKSISGYDKVKITTDWIDTSTYSKDSWLNIVADDELATELYNNIEVASNGYGNNNNKYYDRRYLRIAWAFKQFVCNDSIKSFLCVLTKHPKVHTNLDIEVLKRVFDKIAKYYKYKFSFNNDVILLDSDEYEDKKKNLAQKLKNGEKLFVISVYQTIGAGQNLQYPIPLELKQSLVKINDRDSRSEKDFDAIYLDRPTNLIVNLQQNLEDDALIKYIFQMEMLQEVVELSQAKAFENIKKAFECFRGQVNNVKKPECASVFNMATRVIIQAIGRICRTNMKSKEIFIFVDSEIAKNIDKTILDERPYNKEFVQLVKTMPSCFATPPNNKYINAANLVSNRSNTHILNILNHDWTDESMARWCELRDFVLRHPTLTEADVVNSQLNKAIIRTFYVKMPQTNNQLYYKQDEDYAKVEVSFARAEGYPLSVSAEAAKLDKFINIPAVRSHFEQKNYATSFAKGDYIMSPTLFNNIYRGALGETVGGILLWKYCKINLQEITDGSIFEMFDFKINDSIYVDFKNWHSGTEIDNAKTKAKILRKAKLCSAKCVIVANILDEGRHPSYSEMLDDVKLLVLPSMVNDDFSFKYEAWENIKRCLKEYEN